VTLGEGRKVAGAEGKFDQKKYGTTKVRSLSGEAPFRIGEGGSGGGSFYDLVEALEKRFERRDRS